MAGSILHKIAIKHGLSLEEKADSNKLYRNEELCESEEIQLQMR